MDFDPVFMIRAGHFGSNFNIKFYMALIAFALVAYDYAKHRRQDYLRVLIIGTIIWTCAELLMQTMGTRVMPTRLLFGIELPMVLSTLLQGIAEGSTIAVMGIFVGDRVLNKNTRVVACVAFLLVCALVTLVTQLKGAQLPIEGGVASRRNMVAPFALIFLTIMMTINVVFWLKWKAYRRRMAAMALVMILFAVIWTLSEVAAGSRWIEVMGDAPETYQKASVFGQFFWLSFDAIIEIALTYVPFFAINVMLGRIKSEKPIP